MNDDNHEFICHGYSDMGEVEISHCGDDARIKEVSWADDSVTISDWLEIEHVLNEEFEDEGASGDEGIECFLVIDPGGYNIRLDQVMIA